jgi:hypothetical protein
MALGQTANRKPAKSTGIRQKMTSPFPTLAEEQGEGESDNPEGEKSYLGKKCVRSV